MNWSRNVDGPTNLPKMANQTILNVAHPWTFQTQVVVVCLLLSCNGMSNKTTNQISTYIKYKKKQKLD